MNFCKWNMPVKPDLFEKPWLNFHTFNSLNLLLHFQMGKVILTYSVPSVRDRCLVLLFLTLWTCLGPNFLAHQWHSHRYTRRHLLRPQPLACHLSSIQQLLGWLLLSQQLPPSRQLLCRLPGRLPPRLLAQCPVPAKPRAPLQSRQQPRWPRSLRPQFSPHPWPPLSHHSSSQRLCMPRLLARRWASLSVIFGLRLLDENFPIKNFCHEVAAASWYNPKNELHSIRAIISLGWVAQLVGVLSHTPKSCRFTCPGSMFDPWSGCVQEVTDQFFSPSPSSINISPDEG